MIDAFVATYSDHYARYIRKGETLLLLANNLDSNEWSVSVDITESLTATAAANDLSLAQYTGDRIRGRCPDYFYEYDTSGLTANTKYLAVFTFTRGSRSQEVIRPFTILASGNT